MLHEAFGGRNGIEAQNHLPLWQVLIDTEFCLLTSLIPASLNPCQIRGKSPPFEIVPSGDQQIHTIFHRGAAATIRQ
ncbi:hypothetical protein A6X21_12525 [Planctopirus hydrillae]|uniref:Uncharacterized protein n=1 Tax=Planctopirus hydrillae TaxID=1841610 RepID=A0A1C3E5J6_9PLAN|nr:hypothetical protein A6X21_12525 [Planctopirus hydrillae]